jgi:hypothetical protein
MDVSDDASYYILRKLKIKVAKRGTPKKIFKKNSLRGERVSMKQSMDLT